MDPLIPFREPDPNPKPAPTLFGICIRYKLWILPLDSPIKIPQTLNPNFPNAEIHSKTNPNITIKMSSDPNSASKSIPSISSFQYASYPPSNSNSNFPLPFHLQQNPNPYIQPPPLKLPPQAYPPVVSGVYFLPQFQQAQQLFQRDAQTITPEALESVKAALASNEIEHKANTKKKAIPRKAAGQTWEDPTLAEWPRVVRDKRAGKTRGFGFVSFANSSDLAAAIKEMNGKYVGNRPIKLRKCNWKERTGVEALERQKNLAQKKPKMAKKGILHK